MNGAWGAKNGMKMRTCSMRQGLRRVSGVFGAENEMIHAHTATQTLQNDRHAHLFNEVGLEERSTAPRELKNGVKMRTCSMR